MRNSIFSILLLLMIFSLSLNTAFSQNSDEGFLMVRVFESPDPAYSLIVVTENNEIVDTINLEVSYYKNIINGQLKIHNVIDHYENNGYDLYKMTSGANYKKGMLVTTYLYRREQ